jgi:hypothetical protein
MTEAARAKPIKRRVNRTSKAKLLKAIGTLRKIAATKS